MQLADDAALKDQIVAAAQQTGENVQIGRTASLSGAVIGEYVYSASGKPKSAVLLSLTGNADDTLIKLLGMHIVAARPLALNRAEMPADIVAKEREIAVDQAKATGKPQAIAEKIAEGKLNAFFAEKVLLDQEFINPDAFKGTVAKLLSGKGATLEKYVRIEVGQ